MESSHVPSIIEPSSIQSCSPSSSSQGHVVIIVESSIATISSSTLYPDTLLDVPGILVEDDILPSSSSSATSSSSSPSTPARSNHEHETHPETYVAMVLSTLPAPSSEWQMQLGDEESVLPVSVLALVDNDVNKKQYGGFGTSPTFSMLHVIVGFGILILLGGLFIAWYKRDRFSG